MQIMDVAVLISDAPRAHGVHETVTETRREVYVKVGSATRTEFYQAMNANLRPEYVLKMATEADYQGELKCEFRGKQYRIIRTYITTDGGIELTIQRGDGR